MEKQGGAPGEHVVTLCFPPTPGPGHLFPLPVPEWYPSMVNQQSSKYDDSLSSVSPSRKLIEPKEGIVGTSNLHLSDQKHS